MVDANNIFLSRKRNSFSISFNVQNKYIYITIDWNLCFYKLLKVFMMFSSQQKT